MKALLTAMFVTALALTGCASADSSGSAESAADTSGSTAIDWQDCPMVDADDVESELQCATIETDLVPGDDSKMIDIAVIRMPSTGTDQERIGSLVMNPGGPGASGVDTLVGMADDMPEELTDRFDFVSFDPRGVGYSTPFSCELDDDALDMDEEDESFATYLTYADAVYESCRTNNPDLVEHMSTVDVASDLDALREALGDEQLTYLGFSYGTQIGSVYASLYPDHTRALVLDSSVMPNPEPVEEMKEQSAAFQLAFDRFVAACAQSQSCPMGDDPTAEVQAIVDQLMIEPIVYDQADGTIQELDSSAFVAAVGESLYDTDNWGTLALALSDIHNGGAELLVGTAEQSDDPVEDDTPTLDDVSGGSATTDDQAGRDEPDSYDNSGDVLVAVNCSDAAERLTNDEATAAAEQLMAASPLFGMGGAQQLGSCVPWPTPSEPVPEITGENAPPMLVVANEGDPATPYEWAQRMAETFDGAELLTYEGDGHIAFQRGGECVDTAVVDFLINLTLPASGTSCPAQESERAFATNVDDLLDEVADAGADDEQLQCVYDSMTDAVTPVQLEFLFVDDDSEAISELYQGAEQDCALE